MSYESTAEPIKVGYLMDFKLPDLYPQEMRDDLSSPFELVFDEGLEQGVIDRPIEIVYREVEGLPKGSVKAVIDAYGELVDEGCLAVFGPHITDNCVPTREAIEERFRVPALSVTGSDDWLGEWTFSFPQGSLTDEPIFWADLLAKGGHTEVGVLIEQSLVGDTYLKNFRNACRRKGIRIVAEASLAQTAQDVTEAVRNDARSQAERARALRLRVRDRLRQHGAGVARLGPAAVHEHRVPERVDQPDHVERVHGMDGRRPVRRGQPVGQTFLDKYEAKYGRRPRVLRAGGEPRRREFAAARVHRRASAEPARCQGGARAGEDAARRGRCARHPGVVRKLDPPRMDGRRLSRGPQARCRRRELPSRRPLR